MPPKIPDLLYEEGAVLVFNKPGGLATQAPRTIASLEHQVRDWLKHREEKSGNIYLAVTHRLDRPVSGAIILAKNIRAARRIHEQFASRKIKKIYWAIVEGRIEQEQGKWEDHVRKIPDVAKAEVVDVGHTDGKIALLEYRVLARIEGKTILEIELGTGRYHQIRVQASSRGFPILGDSLYGSELAFGPDTKDERERTIALHARRLRFEHPMLHKDVEVDAPLPESWHPFFEILG